MYFENQFVLKFGCTNAFFQRLSTEQNLTLHVSEDAVGEYFCHAAVPEFEAIVSRGAEVLMNAPPTILSADVQYGEPGSDVHLNCASMSVPRPTKVTWSRYGEVLMDGELKILF